MVKAAASKGALVRSQLKHPVIDADGHLVEVAPIIDDEIVTYLEEAGGTALRERYLASAAAPFDTSTILAQRQSDEVRRHWSSMPSWWGWPVTNTRDRATAHLPRLLYERLDELGIDFTILYPSTTLGLLDTDDEELAGALCHAVNRYLARSFAPYRDRITVGALIPMNTPSVAVAEIDHAVNELGMKAVVISGYARRLLGERHGDEPRPFRLDTFGLDSEYDYDPVWAKCVELGVAPVSHSAHQYYRVSRSASNYIYNHISGLSAAHESLCKSLFLGGVTRRFPDLRVGFLEGGVAWACSLFADLVGHWEKRNGKAILDLDPDRLNVDELMEYFEAYGDPAAQARLNRIRDYFSRPAARPAQLDELAACAITEVEDIRRLFEPHFYFGCEADDPLIAWSFNDRVNPLGARLRPIFGSDISHWDVPDMTEPVAEAWELVDKGVMGEAEFRELTYVNPVRLHASTNPKFFEGTVCQAAATRVLETETGDR
jgi:predicted TIM-barrel fold metal-dependent hydrolase